MHVTHIGPTVKEGSSIVHHPRGPEKVAPPEGKRNGSGNERPRGPVNLPFPITVAGGQGGRPVSNPNRGSGRVFGICVRGGGGRLIGIFSNSVCCPAQVQGRHWLRPGWRVCVCGGGGGVSQSMVDKGRQAVLVTANRLR